MGTLMLLDTATLYYRAFYGVPDTMTAPDGTPVNAVRGLLDMMSRLLRSRTPARLVACLDADWRPAFRTAAIPSYKAHRANPDGTEQAPAALTAQIPVIEQVLGAAGVAMSSAPGYEADDVIGTLAARDAGPVDVVTGDRDLFQVVDDERGVRVIYTARGLSKLEVVDEANLLDTAVDKAREIARNSPLAVWMTKETMWQTIDSPSLRHALDLENRTQVMCTGTGDLANSFVAFRDDGIARWNPL